MSEKTDKWIAFSTACMAATTLISLVIAMYSTNISYHQWQVADTASKQTTIAAKEASEAIQKQLRPYIVFPTLGIVGVSLPANSQKDKSYPISLSSYSLVAITLFNIGATPAFNLYSAAKSALISVADFKTGKRPRFSPSEDELMRGAADERGGEVLGKDKDDRFDAEWTGLISPKDFSDFPNSKSLIYIDAYAIYKDVEERPHYVRQCFGIMPGASMQAGTLNVNQWTSCGLEYDH